MEICLVKICGRMFGGDKKTKITPLSERADFYYHPDDNIDAERLTDYLYRQEIVRLHLVPGKELNGIWMDRAGLRIVWMHRQ
ncbi:hypothetical protein SAMN05518670_4486 [Paenibacillus sp. OK076]|nr:hypothetical protein SAMN05518670_4486 [Paenibacillus sp. OK076]